MNIATEIDKNRAMPKYGSTELIRRVLWTLVSPLFRFSPRIFFAWRVALLRLFGARVGRNVHVYPSARIQSPWKLEIGDYAAIGDSARIYNLGQLTIGARATISQHAHICGGSHDFESTAMELVKAPISIGNDAWICADAFVGPGVVVGEGAVVGARAVVTKNVEPWTIVAGNPARQIRYRKLAVSSTNAEGSSV